MALALSFQPHSAMRNPREENSYTINSLFQLLCKNIQQQFTVLNLTGRKKSYTCSVDTAKAIKKLFLKLVTVNKVSIVSKRDSITTSHFHLSIIRKIRVEWLSLSAIWRSSSWVTNVSNTIITCQLG